MKRLLIFIYVVAFFVGSTTYARSGWQLYDDFNSGSIDLQEWKVDDSSATITVENGRAKFVHQSGYPGDSSWLVIKNPTGIIGIKATITVQSLSGDVRARIAGYGGKVGEDHVWSGLQMQGGMERIFTNTGLEGPPPAYTWVYELHYAQFQRPITVTGNTFIASMLFSNDKIAYEVSGLGKITYKYATTIAPATDFFRAIGTRSSNGDGPCTVFFDDVYVFKP